MTADYMLRLLPELRLTIYGMLLPTRRVLRPATEGLRPLKSVLFSRI